MLTIADYRAAVLGAYRRYRALGEQPRVAYRLATAVTAPLPDDLQSRLLRDAAQAYARARSGKAPMPLLAQTMWRHYYRWSRQHGVV